MLEIISVHLVSSRLAARCYSQLSSLISSGQGLPLPFSSSDLRLSRKTAHLVLQWCMNSTGSFQPSCLKRTMVQSPFCLRSKLIFCAEPFFGPVDHLPQNPLAGLQFEHLHIEAAAAKAELDHAADLASSPRIARPPARKAFDGNQCPIDIVQRRRSDSDLMQNVRHIRLFVPC